jgi:hypothetical protein
MFVSFFSKLLLYPFTLIDRQLGDAAMVLALERIQSVNERNLLAGHVALLFNDYDQAEVQHLLKFTY